MLERESRNSRYKVKKGSMRYLRVIVRCIVTLLGLLKDSIKSKLRKREEKLKDLNDAIALYNDVAKGWLLTAMKKIIISMLSDPELNFDIREGMIDQANRE